MRISSEEVKEELEDGGATNVHDVLEMPTNAGQIANLLDNSLWVGEKHPKTTEEVGEILTKEFYSASVEKIRGWYRKAGVVPGSDINRDL